MSKKNLKIAANLLIILPTLLIFVRLTSGIDFIENILSISEKCQPLLRDARIDSATQGTYHKDFPKRIVYERALLNTKEASSRIQRIADMIVSLRDPTTGLMPSHPGHPGYNTLGFAYDLGVSAMVLKAAGRQAEAEAILDYFQDRLKIPMKDLEMKVDSNGVYGIIKTFQAPGAAPVKSIVNAVNISSATRQGMGELEFFTTPGPTSFIIFAMAAVNPEKYRDSIITLGDALLAMQNEDGGIRDGDRALDRVHTEPHVDSFSALSMLYQITGDEKWRDAAERAYSWFERMVLHPDKGIIDQGLWSKSSSTIFATDCYSWTMAGPAGDRIPIDTLKLLTRNMLRQCLVRVTLPVPDRTTRTVVLVDFSNPKNLRVINSRRGVHPMGSVEWTGGVILALQKNAVRLWESGDLEDARLYKAIAELLFAETMDCFYSVDGSGRLIAFYATGQNLEVAPFGAIENKSVTGWKTTCFNITGKNGATLSKGGSCISAWPVLPHARLNPFIINDPYGRTYDSIKLEPRDMDKARSLIVDFITTRDFTEIPPTRAPDGDIQIVEPKMFNKKMWEFIEKGYGEKRAGHSDRSRQFFKKAIVWASKVIDNPVWVSLAKRDNAHKLKEFGGIIHYPWGLSYPGNDSPLHTVIQKYPLLNEVGAAAWGMATAHYELGDTERSKYWIDRIITDFSLHQIAATNGVFELNKPAPAITGYWNALVSWEENLDNLRDIEMGELYRKILTQKGLGSAKPKLIIIDN